MKFCFKLLLVTILITCLVKIANANNTCISTFNNFPDNSSDQTSAFLAYLGNIIEEDILSLDDLKQFKLDLENGVIKNPIHTAAAVVNPSYQIHYQHLNEFLYENTLDFDRVVKWLENFIQEFLKSKNSSQYLTKFTKTALFQPMIFHPFELSENKVINVMYAPVTQNQWVTIMGTNPSHFQTGEDSETLSVNGNWISLKPDHPVENITLFSAMMFADELSRKHGLPPYYNLPAHIQWKPGTHAANGTLLRDCLIDFREHTGIGYRLPIYSETKIFNQHLAVNKILESQKSLSLLRAWLKENSNQQTHEVAKLKPFCHNGFSFYDVAGNVLEWSIPTVFEVQHKHAHSRPLRYVEMGSSFQSSVYGKWGEHAVEKGIRSGSRYKNVGFRLVQNSPTNEEKLDQP